MSYLLLLLGLPLTFAVKHSWTTLPFSVPATQRLGNRYYIDIDRIDNETIFKSVAMYAHGGEILFGEFKENDSCVTFPSHFFKTKKCNHEFFILHTNYETNFAKIHSPKNIGTYCRNTDTAFVINDFGRMVTYTSITKRSQKSHPRMFEVLCRGRYR